MLRLGEGYNDGQIISLRREPGRRTGVPAPLADPDPVTSIPLDALDRLEVFAETGAIGIAYGDPLTGFRYANRAFCELTGHDISVFAQGGLPWERLCGGRPPEVAPGALVELELCRRDGKPIAVLANYSVRPDNPRGALLIVVDLRERQRLEAELRLSEEKYRHFFEMTPAVFWTADADGSVTMGNEVVAGLVGVAPRLDLEAQSALVHPDERAAIVKVWREAIANGTPYDVEARMGNGDNWHWMRMRSFPQRRDGVIVGWQGVSESVHQRRVVELALTQLQARLARALDGSGVGVWEWDAETDRLWLSDSVYSLGGYALRASEGYTVEYRTLMHPQDVKAFEDAFRRCVEGQSDTFECEVRIRGAHGWLWVLDRGAVVDRDAGGRARRVAGTLTLIAERKRAEERLRWTLSHDSLTGLPNRSMFNDHLQAALRRAARRATRVAVALLDVDRFKDVNDTFGHSAGDALLVALASRLSALVRPGEVVARLGGDEFTLTIPDCGDAAAVLARLQALHTGLREPILHDGNSFDCGTSIGVTLYPDHATEAADLLRNADLAMYQAKLVDRGSVAIYSDALSDAVATRVRSRAAVQAALRDGRIAPVYQAKVELTGGRIIGYEALLRQRGAHARSIVIDESDMAVDLGERMLQLVLADIRRWRDAGLATVPVAINASPAEFRREGYAQRLLEALAAHALPPAAIEVEVTEAVFLDRGVDRVEQALRALRDAGVRVALDDFGTGFASLSHLKRYPVDIIKIDRSFVADMLANPGDAAIVRAVIDIGTGFGIEVVAEGVETSAQRDFLVAASCRFGQGYLFHHPSPAAVLPGLRG